MATRNGTATVPYENLNLCSALGDGGFGETVRNI